MSVPATRFERKLMMNAAIHPSYLPWAWCWACRLARIRMIRASARLAVACSVQARELPSGVLPEAAVVQRPARCSVEHWVPSVALRLRPATTDAVTTALATTALAMAPAMTALATTALATTALAMAPAMTALATMGPATTATAIRGSDVTRACVGATHNLKILAGAGAALLITGSVVPLPAHAQSAPAGSYRGSCTDVRVEDRTLTQ